MRQLRHRGDRPNVDNDLQRHLGEDRKSQLILHLHVGGMFLFRRIQARHLGQLPGTLVEVGEADADGNHEDTGPQQVVPVAVPLVLLQAVAGVLRNARVVEHVIVHLEAADEGAVEVVGAGV